MKCKHPDCYYRVGITGGGAEVRQTACYYAVMTGRSRMSQGIEAESCTEYIPKAERPRRKAQLGLEHIY